jgi:hypothetical protein
MEFPTQTSRELIRDGRELIPHFGPEQQKMGLKSNLAIPPQPSGPASRQAPSVIIPRTSALDARSTQDRVRERASSTTKGEAKIALAKRKVSLAN